MTEYPRWRRPLGEAALISLFILAIIYYWFGVANRYVIFLYGHAATNVPPAQPFDAHSASRHWLAGLVVAGMVLVLYTAAYWLAGRLAARRGKTLAPPAWWRVWALCAVPLALGIPAITMSVNSPTLPPGLAAATTVAALAGLAVALLPGRWAAERPADLLWVVADGVGLMPALLLLRVIELPGRGLSVSPTVVMLVAGGGLAAGAAWLFGLSALRRRRGKSIPEAGALFLAGIGLSYLLLPLAHYLFATSPGLRYISTAGNFFAVNPWLQALAVAVAAVMAWGVTAARRRLARPPRGGQFINVREAS